MKESKAQIMEGVEAMKSKIVANNTVEYTKPDGTRVVRLHHTDILEFPTTGGVVFNSGGWKTATTKDRMNTFQNKVRIIQDKGLWYLTTNSDPYSRPINRDSWIPFFDGVTVKKGKVTNPRKSAHQKEQFWLKKINEYCKELKSLEILPKPSGGDCWDCAFQTDDGRTMGDLSESNHLYQHLKEKYIHGSLIWNALKWAGYQHPEVIFQMDVRTSIVNAVRRYFKSKLGLAC